MAEIRWSLQAADDIESIAEYISVDSPHYSKLFVMDVLKAIERLETFPNLGRITPETSNPLIRELLLGSYRIIYRVREPIVEILTIYHGSRLLDPSKLS